MEPPIRIVSTNVKTKVPVDRLKLGMFVEELDRPWEDTPFLMQGFNIESQEDIDTIRSICEFVYINESLSLKVSYDHLSGKPSSFATAQHGEVIPFTPTKPASQEYERAAKLSDEGRALTKNFLHEATLGKGIDTKQVRVSVSESMKSILANPDAMLWLSKIRDEHQYTAEHCFNVSILALILGRHLGITGNDLLDLGVCGMLHDVGKVKIPVAILNKEGSLNEDEFKIMKAHPLHGRNILMASSNMLPMAIDVAYGHHEAIDGSGYPRGLPASGISEFSRIIQVCDVYDAITSLRVYKEPQSSLTALKILYDARGTKFDAYFVEQFIECIGLYPPGSVVELVSGELAIVLAANYSNRRLPKIIIVRDKNKMPCMERIVDLSSLPKDDSIAPLLIKTTLPNGTNGVRLEDFVKKGLKVG